MRCKHRDKDLKGMAAQARDTYGLCLGLMDKHGANNKNKTVYAELWNRLRLLHLGPEDPGQGMPDPMGPRAKTATCRKAYVYAEVENHASAQLASC